MSAPIVRAIFSIIVIIAVIAFLSVYIPAMNKVQQLNNAQLRQDDIKINADMIALIDTCMSEHSISGLEMCKSSMTDIKKSCQEYNDPSILTACNDPRINEILSHNVTSYQSLTVKANQP